MTFLCPVVEEFAEKAVVIIIKAISREELRKELVRISKLKMCKDTSLGSFEAIVVINFPFFRVV